MNDICISSYSFHNAFENGILNALQFPAFCKDDFGVDRIEFFGPDLLTAPGDTLTIWELDPEGEHVWKMRQACENAGVVITSIAAQNDFSSPDQSARKTDRDRVLRWIDIAAKLDIAVIRINAGMFFGAIDPQDGAARLREEIRQLSETANEKCVVLAVENHPIDLGTVDDARKLRDVICPLSDQGVAACPDNGHIREAVWLDCLKLLLPVAGHAHVKFYEFDEAGQEMTLDYRKFIELVREAEYTGALSIEVVPATIDSMRLFDLGIPHDVAKLATEHCLPARVATVVSGLRGTRFASCQGLWDALGEGMSRVQLNRNWDSILALVRRTDVRFGERWLLARKAVALLRTVLGVTGESVVGGNGSS